MLYTCNAEHLKGVKRVKKEYMNFEKCKGIALMPLSGPLFFLLIKLELKRKGKDYRSGTNPERAKNPIKDTHESLRA